jgi:hypothetical protein
VEPSKNVRRDLEVACSLEQGSEGYLTDELNSETETPGIKPTERQERRQLGDPTKIATLKVKARKKTWVKNKKSRRTKKREKNDPTVESGVNQDPE